MSASYVTTSTDRPALRRTIASSVLALVVAMSLLVFVLGRGPGSLVWFNGSTPTWLPFAGAGLSWLPFGHSNQPSQPNASPAPVVPSTSPSPSVSPSPDGSPTPSPSPSATPTPTPTPEPTPTAAPTATPYPTPTATPTLAPVTAVASASPIIGWAPLTVDFTGVATGGTGSYYYYWDFGDGTMANGASVQHVYALAGNYTAVLTVEDSATTSATASVLITAEQQPAPTVGGVSPAAGPDRGGTQVTITGTYLMNLTAVQFGSSAVAGTLPVPICAANGGCTVTVTSPPNPAGPVDVRVTTPGGTSPALNDQFTYFLSWMLAQTAQPASTTPPSPREGASFVNDGTGVLMFGGYSGTTLLNDTWHWSNGAWSPVTTPPAGTPAARANAAAAYTGSNVILFGGACALPAPTSACLLNDTWSWDPSAKTWTAVQVDAAIPASNQPTQRVGAMLAKDSSGNMLLFGGVATGAYKNDSWSLTGSSWTVNLTTTAPAPRAFGSMANDTTTPGQVVLFGGYNGAFLGDTWTWSLGAWSQVTPLVAPSARKMAAMGSFKNPGGSTVAGLALFGGRDGTGDLGDTWTWTGSSWVPPYGPGPGQPPTRSDAMAAMDTNGSVVMFGGTSTGTTLNDLWRLS